jgi:hypothetical protein
MFVQDYSGFTRAAEIQAQGMQNLGATIGNVAGQVGDYFKQQGEKKKLVKQSSLQIDAALQLFPDLAPSLQSVKERMRDENIPLSDRAAEAEVVANLINTGIGEMRDRSNRSFEQEKFAADQAYRQAGLGMQAAELGIRQQASQQAAESEAAKRSLKKIVVSTPLGEAELDVSVDSQGNPYDIQSGKRIGDLKNYATGEGTWETPEQNMPPTSQVGGSINESALPAPLRKYASSFVEQGAKYGVDPALLAAISMHETANGKSSAFRNKNNAMGVSNASGPIQMGSVEASIEKMANLLGKGINQGKGPYANAKSIEDIAKRYAPIGAGNDPRGLNKYWTNGVSSNYEKLSSAGQSDNSTSMIGDLSQQAMGTPEQQAEVARMIEQGSGMGTAEAVLSGAMATEPSLSQQQPQLPQQAQPATQPRLARGRLLSGGGQQQQGTIMTQQQVNELEASGRQVSAVPTPDGNFRVTSVRTGTPQMGFEMTYDEQGRPILKQSATGVGAAPKVGEGQILSTDASGRPSIVNIPGGKADIEAQEATKAAERERILDLERANIGLSEIDKLIGYAGEMSRLPGASTYRKFAPIAGFMKPSEVENALDTVKAAFRFETLQRLKEASPTGSSGLGAVTKPEFDALAEEKGKLTQVGDPRELQRRATNYKKMILDTIHGSKKDRDELLKEGKITKESYDAVESLYPGFQKKQPLAPEVIDIRKRLLGE